MTEYDNTHYTDTWSLLSKLFIADAPLSKSQYIDKIRSDKTFLPEVQLWLDVLKITCDDWLNYKETQTSENFKCIKDIDSWVYKDSFAINRLSEAVFLAFDIEPEVFKIKFRQWLERERVFTLPSYQTDVPFESVKEEIEFYYDINSGSTENS